MVYFFILEKNSFVLLKIMFLTKQFVRALNSFKQRLFLVKILFHHAFVVVYVLHTYAMTNFRLLGSIVCSYFLYWSELTCYNQT